MMRSNAGALATLKDRCRRTREDPGRFEHSPDGPADALLMCRWTISWSMQATNCWASRF